MLGRAGADKKVRWRRRGTRRWPPHISKETRGRPFVPYLGAVLVDGEGCRVGCGRGRVGNGDGCGAYSGEVGGRDGGAKVCGVGARGGARCSVPGHRGAGYEIAAGNDDAEIARAVGRVGDVYGSESGFRVLLQELRYDEGSTREVDLACAGEEGEAIGTEADQVDGGRLRG